MNKSYHNHNQFIIWLSFFIALILQSVSLPVQIAIFFPNWILLTLIYWILALPHCISIGTSFILSIIRDLLLGKILGVSGFSFSLAAYFLTLKAPLIRNMRLFKQSCFIILISLSVEILIFLAEFSLNTAPFSFYRFLNSFTNGVIWPLFFLLMRSVRRYFNVQ